MIRVGVIGTGFMGSKHCENIAWLDNAELAVVYDVDAKRAQDCAQRYGAKAASVPEQIIEDSTIDAVVIATSSDTHRYFLEAAVKADKWIYCEKPLAVNEDERKELENIVQGYEERIFVGFGRRFDSHYQVLKQQVPRIGAIEMIHIINRGPSVPPLEYIKISGGQFHDQCIHFFDLLRWFSGTEVQSIYAQGAALADPRVADYGDVDTSLIHINLVNGGFASLDSARRTAYGYDERIELHGSKGLLRSPALLEHQVELLNEQGSSGAMMPSGWFARLQDSFRTAMESFVHSVENKIPCSPNCTDGFIAQRLAEHALKSFREHQVVEVNIHG